MQNKITPELLLGFDPWSRRPLGQTSLRLSPIGFGAWALGGGDWQFGWGSQSTSDSVDAIQEAIASGVNWIDTAPAYGLGHSERLVGAVLKGMPLEQRPLLFTKCGFRWGEDRQLIHDLSPSSLLRQADESRERLNVEKIDLYQIHWPSWNGNSTPDHVLTKAWEALATLRDSGVVRYLGASNFSLHQLQLVHDVAPLACIQPPYSLINRGVESGILSWCEEKRVGVIAYSPMESGLLAGSMTRQKIESLAGDDWRRQNPEFQEPLITGNLRLGAVLNRIASDAGIHPGQLAISWVLKRSAVTGAIVGARSASQVSDLFRSVSFALSSADLELLEDC